MREASRSSCALSEVLALNRAGFWGAAEQSPSSPNPARVLRNGDIGRDGSLSGSADRWFSDRELEVARLLPGDVAITTSGEVGKLWLVDQPGYFASNFVRILRANADRTAPEYLYYLLQAPESRDILGRNTRGATISNLASSFYDECRVPLPPLPEQRRIVAILEEALQGIAKARANVERNIENARIVLSKTFTILAPSEEQSRWTKTTVASLAAPHKGSIRPGPFGSQLLHSEFVNEGIAVLGIDNAVANEFRWGKSRFVTHAKYKKLERYTVRPGDVLITIMGTCGRCAVVPDDIPLAINTKHLCCITLDRAKCLPEYLHAYFLYHPIALEFLAEQAGGTVMDGLNMGIIQQLPVLVPSIDRQFDFMAAANDLRSSTQQLVSGYGRKLTAFDELRKSLLHQAFAGRL